MGSKVKVTAAAVWQINVLQRGGGVPKAVQRDLYPQIANFLTFVTFSLVFFSESELTFTFAICCRPSVCRLSVTFVRFTQAVQIFRNISTALGTSFIDIH